jgi:DNA modification methylase
MRVLQGSCRDHLREGLVCAPGELNAIVTSPPYWGLRDYGVAGQFGQEPTVAEYVANLVNLFREARPYLKDDGAFWLNLGDSYASWKDSRAVPDTLRGDSQGTLVPIAHNRSPENLKAQGLKNKDLVGVPWRVAFALQDDGWYLRSEVIWAKPNPMPESVKDRPTRSHEHVFLFSKSERYWYDGEPVREVSAEASLKRYALASSREGNAPSNGEYKSGQGRGASRGQHADHLGLGGRDKQRGHSRRHAGFNERWDSMPRDEQMAGGANSRDVWWIATRPYRGAHFAVMPNELARRMILTITPERGLVYDPFFGAGTTGLVAAQHGRRFVGSELNADYIALAQRRIAPTLAQLSLL